MSRRCRSCKMLSCECSRRPAVSASAFFYGTSFHSYDRNHPAFRSPQQPTSDGAAQLTTGPQDRLATEPEDHDSGEAAASETPFVTGPTPALWTTSLPYRVAVDPSDPGRHAYFTSEAHAVAYLDRNVYLERVVELSPRYALDSERVAADEMRAPTAGNVEAYELNGPGGAGTELT